jgi:predicted metal-dependent HD superfamily phosphohydrolase
MSNNIYKRVATYVTALFEQNPHPNLLFHTIAHTKGVVARTEEIAAHYQLKEADTLAVYIAAWFHDTGHLFVEMERHEEKSIELMREFMAQDEDHRHDIVEVIAGCIVATKMPHGPRNLLQEILCDADTYHFGTADFKATNKLVKKELILRGYATVTRDWLANTITMLEEHKYFTSYCQVLLNEGKHSNIERLKKKKQVRSEENVHHGLFGNELNSDDKARERNGLLARGIQTMLRLSSANHQHLSELADRKANILISVNSIMISVILSFLVRRLADSPFLTVPAVVFLVSTLSTIILAILSTRPKITEGKFQREDILNKKTNLMFFGNFYRTTAEEYEWAMSQLMKDHEYVYSVLVRDIYQIGIVLGRKYRLIRLAYTVFMVGLIASVLTFFVASIIHANSVDETSISVRAASGSPL